MKVLNTTVAAVALLGAIAAAPQAHATTAYRTVLSHSATTCTGTLNADTAKTRASSEGLRNVKTGLSDVRCGGVGTPLANYNDVEYFETAIRNSTAGTVQVNCSLSDGLGQDVTGVTTTYPRSASLGPGEVYWFSWSTLDTGGANFSYPTMNCQLPTSVSTVYTLIMYQEDVGL